MNQVLYIAAATGKGGSIVTWDTKTWKRIGSKTVVRDTISAFSVSPDGKFLACGTTQGDVFILNSASKQVQTVVRKAHLGFVTALSFSHDSRALASVSLDSSARVTLIEEKREAGELSLWVVFVLLLAVVAYFMKNQGIQLGVTVLKIFKSLVELS
ncbi:SEC12-like protein 2 [Quercus suber]